MAVVPRYFARNVVRRAFAASAGLGLLGVVASPSFAQRPEPASLAEIVATLPGEKASDPLMTARCSLQLKNAPLAQMLGLLGATNDIRFRFAAVPDATVSVALNDALLLPTLHNILHASGFDAVRHDRQLWIIRRLASTAITASTPARQSSRSAAAAGSSRAASRAQLSVPLWPATWQLWTRVLPPGKGWMAPLALKTPVNTAQRRADNVRSTAPTPEPEEPPLSLSGWQTLALDFSPDPLGVAVRAPQSTLNATARTPELSQSPVEPTMRSVWLRWPFWLRQLPRGAQLRLHTAGEATLWINGARVLPRWNGTRILEVDSLLQTGFNCLAVQWHAPAAESALPGATRHQPWLRYEWLFAAS